MSDRSDRFAVIGAGPAGLAIARALRKHGVAYDQFEADTDVGGNWYHGVYETAHIISSRWDVTLSTGDGLTQTAVYNGVLVCNGHHWDRRMPQVPGTFAGELIHSKEYRRVDQLRDKRVPVIGAGNSACDVASEAARVSRSADIAIRRGYGFLPKTILGVPLPEVSPLWLPVWAQRLFLRAMLRVIVGKYESYGLQKPRMRLFDTHPTINSELLHYLKHGRLKARPGVVRFDGGSMLPTHKHLYIVGWAQARYGIGPLITAGADVLCEIIKLQDECELPLGLVLRESGERIPETHLMDPGAVLRRMRRARWMLPLLRRRERKLRARLGARLGASPGASMGLERGAR